MSLWMFATNVKYDCLANFRVVPGSYTRIRVARLLVGNLLGNSRVTHHRADLPHPDKSGTSYRSVTFCAQGTTKSYLQSKPIVWEVHSCTYVPQSDFVLAPDPQVANYHGLILSPRPAFLILSATLVKGEASA